MVKNLAANAADIRNTGLIPGSGRSPAGGHGNPLQYSCLETFMDRGPLGCQPESDTTEVTARTRARIVVSKLSRSGYS